MPTLEHNAIIEMFRDNPSLLPRFLATLLHVEIPPYASVTVVESSLDQLIPVEFRADLVHELRDENGVLVLSVVVEIQRDKDPNKKYSLPVYVTVERAKKRCDTIVLVIALDPDVAAWAAEEINLGLGRGSIEPLVLGPGAVPRITERAVAARSVELSVLSAMVHGNGPNGMDVVRAAMVCLDDLDREHAMVYYQVIYNMLAEPMKRALEAMVMDKQSVDLRKMPPFIQEMIDKAFREGQLEGELKGERKGERKGELKGELKGKVEGKVEGRFEGKVEGLRDALLRLIGRTGISLTDEERARIQTCCDVATLDRWIENVIGAKVAADILS